MTYLELIEHFRGVGKIRVETECSVFPDFQKTIEIYSEGYWAVVHSGKDPRQSLELKKRKYQMQKWLNEWPKYKIIEL